MDIDERARAASAAFCEAPIGDPPAIAVVRRRRDRRRATVAAVSVVAVLLAGAPLVARVGDGRPEIEVSTGRTTGTTAAVTPTSDGATPTSAMTVPRATERPGMFVGVREDGSLVVVEGGRSRVIANEGDPREDHAEGGPSFVEHVALDRARSEVHYSVCCEPAAGHLRRMRLDGTGDQEVNAGGGGYYPTVSPDGRYLAFGIYMGLVVVDLQSGSRHVVAIGDNSAVSLRPAWSVDGELLAFEREVEARRLNVFVVRRDATSLADARNITPAGQSWSLPAFRNDGMLIVAQQCCRGAPGGEATGIVVDPASGDVRTSFTYEGTVLDQSYDDTGTFLLYVTGDHVLRWRGRGEVGTLGRGFRNADW